MRRLYALSNRNPPLPIPTYDDDIDDVRIIQSRNNNVIRNENKTIVRKTTNNVI
ncbi:unnamed protein product, partial [Rotaria sp. Silwood1]